jgi:uncharacterized protein YheU (UPF0270 family)
MTHVTPHSEIDEATLDRVRKLLTMAERTDNTEEADAFSRKAAELIARHRLHRNVHDG